jgi:hypothetical protein
MITEKEKKKEKTKPNRKTTKNQEKLEKAKNRIKRKNQNDIWALPMLGGGCAAIRIHRPGRRERGAAHPSDLAAIN